MFKNFVQNVGDTAVQGGSDFHDIPGGESMWRLALYTDNGEPDMGFTFYQHWVDKRPSVCMAKTFKDGSYCEKCEEEKLVRKAGDNERARDLAAKPMAWFAASKMDGAIGILGVTGATSQKILGAIAQVGGWSGDPNFQHADFLGCVEKGAAQCFGERARDLFITRNDKAPFKDRYKVRFSVKPGQKIDFDDEAPNLRERFLVIKKIGGGGSVETESRGKGRKPATKKATGPRKTTAKTAPRTKRKARG